MDSIFQGAVTVTLGGVGTFSGTWDGANTFSGLLATLPISITPSRGIPLNGPQQITSNGMPFNFVGSASGIFNSRNADVYQSASGMQIVINPDGTVTLTRADGSQVSGTYNASTRQFSFGDNSIGVITANDGSGQALNTLITGGQTTEINGGLDVLGNVLTLGSWANGATSANAFTLSFTDAAGGQPSLLNFGSTRSSTKWLWSRAQYDASSTQVPMMLLDASLRLLIYGPSDSSNPAIILDPAGSSAFHGPVRVRPQGDISMGAFHNGPTPP